VQRRSGCALAAHAETVARIADVEAQRNAEDDYQTAMFRLHGAGEEVVKTVAEVSAWALDGAASLAVGRVLYDGDVLRAGGSDLLVALRPGHSPSDTLYVSDRGWALLGDHLLGSGPSPVLADRPAQCGDPAQRPHVILTYREGLRRTAELGLGRGLAGHGRVIEDPAGLVAERLAALERRARKLRDRMPRGPVGAWALTTPRPARGGLRHPISSSYLALSEVLGLLDLLLDCGLVTERRDEAGVVYERT